MFVIDDMIHTIVNANNIIPFQLGLYIGMFVGGLVVFIVFSFIDK